MLHDRLRALAWRHAHTYRGARPSSTDFEPLKVMHVTTSFDLGGTQTQIKHLCTASSARYHHSATEIFPELNFLYREGVTLERGRYVTGGPVARWLGRAVLDRSRRGVQLVQHHKLVHDFRRERPQVVVGWGHEICVTTFTAAAVARVPHIVFCIRTFNPAVGWTDAAFGSLLQQAHRRMAPYLSATVVNSTVLRDDHSVWAGVPQHRIAVCANGVAAPELPAADRAAARERIRRAHGIPADAVVVTNIGRFSPEKGQRSLIEANRLAGAVAHGRPIVWLLCGDGPLLDDVRSLAASHGLTNVVFAGRTRDVAPVLAASDLFVMPSQYEGMPNAMLEAMAMGLPCISTRLSGARDIARDGVEALYYDWNDAPALAQRVRELLGHAEYARQLGAAARARAREFDVPSFVRCFETILDEAVTAPGQNGEVE